MLSISPFLFPEWHRSEESYSEKSKNSYEHFNIILSLLCNPFKLLKLIDDLECQQELINDAIAEEKDMLLCKEAFDRCFGNVTRHLDEFLMLHSSASYEEWILALHPDNVREEHIVDHRFYVEDSDHRDLWNNHVCNKFDTSRQISHQVSDVVPS